jgi:TolB-like protein
VAGAIVLLVCFLVVLWGYLRPVETVRVSLAVLPLDNLSGDPEQQYFTDGMTDAITTDLARIGTLRVLSHTTSAAYLNRPDPLQAMARDLQVASVVEGSVLRAGNRVRISVRLVDTKSSRHLWAQNYEGDLRDILLLQSSVAQAIAQEVRVRLTAGEQAQLASRERVNPKAYEAYLKGRHLTLRWRREDIHKGRDWFRVAIAEDPKYAAAWLGLADTYITEGFYWGTKPLDLLPEAERCAQKALELDPAMAAPHRVLALIAGVYRRDWPEAKRRFDRSFALDPTGVWSHYNYAAYYLVPTGRFEEALREIRIARDIDPASPNIATMTGWVHFFRRDYVPAAAEFRKALELDHDFAYARMGLSTVLALQGDPAGALALNSSLETTAWLHALLGHAAEARRLLKDMAERSRREYVGGYEMGYIHAALGETTLALQQLERSYDDCQPHLADLAVDPRLDSLRDLPRFQALVRKMNLAR